MLLEEVVPERHYYCSVECTPQSNNNVTPCFNFYYQDFFLCVALCLPNMIFLQISKMQRSESSKLVFHSKFSHAYMHIHIILLAGHFQLICTAIYK